MLRGVIRAVLALVTVAALAAPAHAQRHESPLRSVAQGTGQEFPVIELVTMGIGSLIWERHGHIALCVRQRDPREDACYNYGIGDFHEPLKMAWGFFRGANSFWVGKMNPDEMLALYSYEDRSIMVQT